MESDKKIFNDLLNIRQKINLIHKENNDFNQKNKSKDCVFIDTFYMLCLIYSRYSVQNNQIKDINFLVEDSLFSNKYSDGNYRINFKENTLSYKNNKIEIKFLHGECVFTYKKNAQGYFTYSKNSIGISSVEIIENIKELNLLLDKTIAFKNHFMTLLRDNGIQNFVSRYKENRELLTVVFLHVPNNLKEGLFNEIKKQDKALCMDDVINIVTLLKKSSKDDEEHEDDGNILSLPMGRYNALLLEENIKKEGVENLFAYHSLDEKLIDNTKDGRKINKVKI